MKTVTLSVASREDVTRRALAAFEGQEQGAHISFRNRHGYRLAGKPSRVGYRDVSQCRLRWSDWYLT